MFFVSAVRSSAGAAGYFAGDNYYTQGENADASRWAGNGAAALGLSGRVDKDVFEGLLNSTLPSGTQVNTHESRRTGLDLTFSMPKSASVLAYVGGDERILQANRNAVAQAMKWVEKNTAEVRTYVRDRKAGDAVRTGNLVYAMFEHDTSRALDPQAHIHVVVAAISQTAQGKWRALWNGEIYKNNSTIGSIYHAALRSEIEKLGYETRLTGKHGQFEINGVPPKVVDEFSQRRREVLEKASALGITTPQGMAQVTRRTREDKVLVEDHEALRREWVQRAEGNGYDAKEAVAQAKAVIRLPEPRLDRQLLAQIVTTIQDSLAQYLRPDDPLTTSGLARLGLTPTQVRTEMAVASAIRILGQNEAAFDKNQIIKKSLDLDFKHVTAERVEARIEQLADLGRLIAERPTRIDGVITKYTTPEHIALERTVLAHLEIGRGMGQGLGPRGEIAHELAALDPASLVKPVLLNAEQISAASKALASSDRVFVIQGVAGAGKSTMIDALARVAENHGKEVLGLAIANEMVKQLRSGSNIEAASVSAFVNRHLQGAMAGQGPAFDRSKHELANKIIIVDEGSMVGTKQALDLLRIAAVFEIGKFIDLGDREQLLPVEHGNSMASLQASKPDMAVLTTSLRQQTFHMKLAAQAARGRDIGYAFAILGERLIEGGKDFRNVAAQRWLSLSPDDRAKTDIYTSGRDSRAAINELVQAGLKAEGTLRGDGVTVDTLLKVNLTREELRFAHSYEQGMTLEVVRNGVAGRLQKGRYEITSIDTKGRVWVVGPGGKRSFEPGKMPPNLNSDALKLSERLKIKIYEGDTLRMEAADNGLGIAKADKAQVLFARGDKVTIRMDDGQIHHLKPVDSVLQNTSLRYALNMHQAQGITQEQAIGAMNSNEQHLSNARLFHVMVTRVRQNIEIVTNNIGQLQRAIESNMGDKAIALGVTGELKLPAQQKPHSSTRMEEEYRLKIFTNDMQPWSADLKPPQKDVPEKVKERGL